MGVAAHSTVRATTLLPSRAVKDMPVHALESVAKIAQTATAANNPIIRFIFIQFIKVQN
jgi:hypothetical protein